MDTAGDFVVTGDTVNLASRLESVAKPGRRREAEFAALRRALGRLVDGEGGIVTIVGEAGIGKSRLVAEPLQLPIHH